MFENKRNVQGGTEQGTVINRKHFAREIDYLATCA